MQYQNNANVTYNVVLKTAQIVTYKYSTKCSTENSADCNVYIQYQLFHTVLLHVNILFLL